MYGGGTSEICTGGCGILFNLQPSASAPRSVSPQWNENTFHHFLGTPDGANPTFGNLVFDSSGTIYGTSPFGGQMQGCNQGGCGTVFKAARSGGSWTESVVYAFTGERDGAQPYGNITFDSNGSLYSTTHQGGVDDLGTVFQLTPTQTGWVKTTVHDFTGGSDGSLPYAGLISDSAGNLYGTTSAGGSSNAGVVFELTRNGSGWGFAYSTHSSVAQLAARLPLWLWMRPATFTAPHSQPADPVMALSSNSPHRKAAGSIPSFTSSPAGAMAHFPWLLC